MCLAQRAVFHHVSLLQMCCKVKRSSLEDLMSGKHLVESETRRMRLMRPMFVNMSTIHVALRRLECLLGSLMRTAEVRCQILGLHGKVLGQVQEIFNNREWYV